ncbi:MAG: T9SS type A sorting domain-containing protein [Candidatus Marinimicrobia bacterium]|nr:T9SS type A sorting domain-containing protein [Candidatus Neomarinimicrobiota bacterium]
MKKLLSVLCIVTFLFAANPEHVISPVVASTTYQTTRTMVNISNWAYWVYYNGQTGHSPDGRSGGIYPRGTASAIYHDGFVWGGYFDTDDNGSGDQIRVGGSTYNIGTIPGRVITGGTYSSGTYSLADMTDASVRVYRVREDYDSLTHEMLIPDAAELNNVDISSVTHSMTQDIMDQYELDWDEWPVAWGAPYNDLDGDGIYTAGVDEPGMARAEQTAWCVVNDYSATASTSLYGSQPIGVELQITVWAYDYDYERRGHNEPNTLYKSFKLINKSGRILENAYVSQWSDPDIGSAGNDLIGCDSIMGIGYVYNGEVNDEDFDYYYLAPPSIGYLWLQGPMVPGSPTDTAWIDFKKRGGYKNMPMTSFGWFSAGSAIEDPELGEYVGSLQFYNLMRGYVPTENIASPTRWHKNNDEAYPTTFFPMHSDPATVSGDLDGTGGYFAPGDRRFCLSSGPFDLAPGDTQQVIVALVGGLGYDNISSYVDMRTNAHLTKDFFENRRWEPWEEPAPPPEIGIAEIVQLDAPDGAVVDDNLFHSLNYAGDGSQPWHTTAGAPIFFVDSRSGDLWGEYLDRTIDRFHNCGTSDFEIVFGDSSIAWSYTMETVLPGKVPFAIYKYDTDGTVRRQFIAIYDNQISGTDNSWDQGLAMTYTTERGFEEIYSYDNSGTGYQVSDEAAYISANNLASAPSNTGWAHPSNPYEYPQLNNVIIGMYPEGGVGPPTNGTVIRLNTFKPDDDPSSVVCELDFELGEAYPNPFNPSTTIPFTLTESDYVGLKIFDMRGRCVETLIDHLMDPGMYRIPFDARELASGVYIYRLRVGQKFKTGKMILKK